MSGLGENNGSREPSPQRRPRRRRTIVIASITACVGVAAGITLSTLMNGDRSSRDTSMADRAHGVTQPTGDTSGGMITPSPSASKVGGATTAPTPKGPCRVGPGLVPTCGALWGVSPDSDGLATLERRTGRKFDLVQVWHGIDQGDVPRPPERKMLADGHILHYNFAAKNWGAGSASYADIAAGKYDSAIDQAARNLKALGKPVFVTFDHEADQKARRQRGTPQQFVAAWRHIHDRYKAAGADNVVWVWVVTGYPGNFAQVPSLYPGNAYVDWVSWEAENGAGCPPSNRDPAKRQTFEQLVSPFYKWLKSDGVHAGIDASKPYMITGFGTIAYPSDPGLSARWYRDVPAVLKKYPQIKAVQLWNSSLGPTCDFRITTNPQTTKAFATAGAAPHVNPKLTH
ncbi:MAG TPA: glycosyl hydrolase family 26 [Streptosporangiaceae bacterium]|jgi:hypothetical protein